jgi:hypothetical protein
MENFRNFLKKNFITIVFILMTLNYFGSCSDNRELVKLRKEITAIKDSTYIKRIRETIKNNEFRN